MGEKDIQRQAPNVARMKMLGATVVPATSGSKTLKDATNEAIRDWINHPVDTHYIIGSVVGPHPYPDMVARFQSVISAEIKWQLKEKTGSAFPEAVIACVGGGSNAAGAFFHFLDEKRVRLIAVEAAGEGINSGRSAATTSLGTNGILHGSRSLVMQTADGQVVEPHSISAGLDYPGIGPLHAHLFRSGRASFYSATDQEALNAAFLLARLEGIIPALESAHALAILEKIHFNKEDHVVICLSGRGDKDLDTYMKAMADLKIIETLTMKHRPCQRKMSKSIVKKRNMSRIDELFSRKKQNILNVYFTAGFPGLNDTLLIMKSLQDAGADMIELGMPYSDPLADGPVIQSSSSVALTNGMTMRKLFEQLNNFRKQIQLPVLLMGYMNPITAIRV